MRSRQGDVEFVAATAAARAVSRQSVEVGMTGNVLGGLRPRRRGRGRSGARPAGSPQPRSPWRWGRGQHRPAPGRATGSQRDGPHPVARPGAGPDAAPPRRPRSRAHHRADRYRRRAAPGGRCARHRGALRCATCARLAPAGGPAGPAAGDGCGRDRRAGRADGRDPRRRCHGGQRADQRAAAVPRQCSSCCCSSRRWWHTARSAATAAAEHVPRALRVGDVLCVESGDVAPADARLLEACDLEVDDRGSRASRSRSRSPWPPRRGAG